MKPAIKHHIEQIRQGEVPEGYKKVNFSIIPNSWSIHTVSEHLKESRIAGSKGNDAKKITVKLWNKGVVEKKEIHSGSENTQYYRRKQGQFIYSKLDFLNCAFGIVPKELDGYESTLDLPTFDIRGINEKYLLLQVIQKRFYEHWGLMAANGGRKARRISPDDFLSFPIPFPPLPEQQKIAAILTTQDRVIELKQQLLAQKQQQKKYLMQQLLTGKKRLPGFSGEWKKELLGNIAVRHIKRNTIGNSNVLTISAQYGLINQSEFFNKTIASDDKSDYYLLEKGDFAYNKSYSSGYPFGAIKRLTRYDIGIVSPLYICFRISKENVSGEFLDQYFEAGLLNHEIQAIAQEGARNHGLLNIAIDDFFNLKILLPPFEEQTAIANVLSTADREIDLLRQNIEAEKQKKKALMQLLLTGIVRVTV